MNKLVFDRPVLNPPRFHDEPWTLAHDWTVVFRGEYYHLPAGFETDGASIPRPLWWICGTPLEVPRLYAALVHDFIYGGNDPEATRADADDLYRDLQIALGVPRWKCYVEWLALRLCGRSHWYENQKGKSNMKITHLLLSACCLAAVSTGCKSIEVDRRGHQVAMDGQGQVIKDKDGNPIIIDLGWNVDYFQHWNWQKFDSLHAKAGEAELDINGYSSGADSNIVALVSTSLDGAARITEKIVAAIITYGGSVAAEGGSAAIVALANKFIAAGGDETKATVTCKDGSCTVTDGSVTCTESGCIDCKPTAQ